MLNPVCLMVNKILTLYFYFIAAFTYSNFITSVEKGTFVRCSKKPLPVLS